MTCSRCERSVRCAGLCNRHYQAHRRAIGMAKACSVETCNLESYSKGFCKTHWRHWKATGDPLVAPPIVRETPMSNCRVPGCPHMASTVHGDGLCRTHTSRLYQGLDLFTAVTPGKRGRKPYIPGIPDALRRANSEFSMLCRRGEKPTRAQLDQMIEYNRLVRAWRLTQRPAAVQLAALGSMARLSDDNGVCISATAADTRI